MPDEFDFDDVDLTAAPVNTPETAARTVSSTTVRAAPEVAVEQAPSVPDEMDEVELRMAKLQCYWSLVQMYFFENPDEIQAEVEAEVHDFVRGRLAELMGSVPKKRGRKPTHPAPVTKVSAPVLRKAAVTPKVMRGPVTAKPMAGRPTDVPSTATDSHESITQEFTSPDGQTKQKVYRKFVDKESNRGYYLGYDRNGTELVGDGNKYEVATNSGGGQYFRVISQQSLPPGVIRQLPLNSVQQEAQAYAHAQATLGAIKKNSLLSAALQLSQQG